MYTHTRRARFFQLADIFLSSSKVPAYSAAAFAKRFARCALTAPPGAAMVAIAFVHNILRRHPPCAVMLHRPTPAVEAAAETAEEAAAEEAATAEVTRSDGGAIGAAVGGAIGRDVYDESEEDPAYSRAIESSLWEVEALRLHYRCVAGSGLRVLGFRV